MATARNPARTPPLRKSDRARQAILEAARDLFAERGYDGTTVRAVAARASIDPAMVIRYFGGKDELFVRAAEFDLQLPPLDQVPPHTIGEGLLRHYLQVWEEPQGNIGLAVLLRSAASNELSAQKMREVFAGQVMPALARVGDRATAPQRAGMVASQLLGLALTRYVLRFAPLVAMSVDELVDYAAPTIQRYALGPEAPRAAVRRSQR
jgi:AcrR family transcriptional regulator